MNIRIKDARKAEKLMTDNKLALNDVYMEISEQLGMDAAMKIYEMYRGQQISFPVRFFNSQRVKDCICEEYNGTNIKELAKKYDYSEKSIRRIIKEQKLKESK